MVAKKVYAITKIGTKKVVKHSYAGAKNAGRKTKKVAIKTKRKYSAVHKKVAQNPHEILMQENLRYAKWHNWKFKKIHHGHVHFGALVLYILFVGVLVFNNIGFVLAADLSNTWNFSSPGDFNLSSEVETSGSSVRLKAREYANDSSTAALYHLNETSGVNADDGSSNNNDLTINNSATFGMGAMNNGLSLNGTNQSAQAADSASLSISGQQSLEAWIKPNNSFDNTSSSNQTILDKGSYKLGLDRTTGKTFYEIENSNNQWSKKLGDGLNGSWEFNHGTIESIAEHNSDIYVGLGISAGDAEVWKWNGSVWSKIGGDGLASSWNLNFEEVKSLAVKDNTLFAGLGYSSGDGEVWSCDLITNCSSWSKIGGDGIGIANSTQTINSLIVHGGSLFAATGSTVAGFGDVYRYDGGTNWTHIGGDGVNSSWAANTYENVLSLYSEGSNLYAGLGSSTNDAEVWKYDGTSWSKIGGDGLASSWNSNYETVESLNFFNGNLYAGLGLTNNQNDGEVWKFDGTSWSKIGGDGINSSWSATTYNRVLSLSNDGTNLYAGTGIGTAAGIVWKFDGTSWSKIGGNGVSGSFNAHQGNVMIFTDSKLYAGVSVPSPGYPYFSGGSLWEYNGSAWTVLGGNYVNNSWGTNTVNRVVSSTNHNGKAYFGLGGTPGAALVYEFDGNNSRLVGGNGINNSWGLWTYEEVTSMVSFKGSLYAGLGTSPGEGEVWKYDGTSWTMIGGDSLNGSWSTSAAISAMTTFNGNLYVAIGSSATGDQRLYKYDGSSWSIANNSWAPAAFGFISSLTVWNGQLCVAGAYGAGASVVCGDGDNSWNFIGGNSTSGSWDNQSFDVPILAVYKDKLIVSKQSYNNSGSNYLTTWQYDGSSWTKIGGDAVNSSWASTAYKLASPMTVYNGELYVGAGGILSNTANADVWRWDGTAWEQVGGGSGINNSWAYSDTIEQISTMLTYKGKLYVGLGQNINLDALVYAFGNNAYVESTSSNLSSNWHHIAASYDGVNMKLFIDGTQSGSSAISVTGSDNNLSLMVGMGYGTGFSNDGTSAFKGQIDEVRISNVARNDFISKPYSNNNQTVDLAVASRTSGVASWDGMSASETSNGGSIRYRLSDDDGNSWKFWNGSDWVVSSDTNQSNNINVINAHIGDFPVTFSGIRWQSVLKGDGSQQVQLNSVTLTANSDSDAPTNASNINMYKSNGGDSITNNSWTNASTPYFSWTAGSDSGSGILGYCLYLGTSGSADPAITKGLLGVSPANTGGNCQFAVSNTNFDLSQSGMLATALTTNNDNYYLNIKAIDKSGNLSSASQQFVFRFDNTPPTNPGYITAPSQFVSSKEVTFTWPTSGQDAPKDDNSGLAGLQYRIGQSSSWYGDGSNGSGLLANDGSYTTRNNPDYANINEGNNTVYFRVVDQAGNVTSSYATAALKLNTTSPTSPQNISANPATNTTNSFEFSWTPPTTFSGDVGAITYCYTVNTTPTVNTCNYTNAGVTSLPAGAYATQPGENTFYVVAKDEAGNINYATAGSTTFTANTAAPGIPLDLDIADVSVKSTSAWKLAVTWEPPSNVGAGIASYQIFRSTDNNSFSRVASTSGNSYVDSNLSQQQYYYKVKACDSANNCGAFSVIKDATPTGKFTSPALLTAQPSVSEVSTKKATIKWATDRKSDSKISLGTSTGQYDPFQVASQQQVTDHSIELTNLTPGTTYFAKAVWTDEDGNTGLSSEFSFKTEPAPSTQEVITQRIGLSSAVIRFTSVSASKVVVQFGKSDSFGGIKEVSTSLSKSSYDVELPGLEDGSKYFYRLNTFDADGNEYTGSTTLSFTTPARPRISNLRFQPVEGEPTSTQKVTWTTNVPASSLIRFSSAGIPTKEVSNSKLTLEHEIVIKDLQDDTSYTLTAESRDEGGNLTVSDNQTLKTALDTRPPKISDIAIETTIRGTGAEARGQIVVSWKTDEPATSQVAYGEGSQVETFNNKTAEDGTLALEHIVIVSDLPTSRVYSVQPISKDHSQNTGNGETKSAIIAKASDSILTIVLGTLKKIFGF